jgi:hypothetical protein
LTTGRKVTQLGAGDIHAAIVQKAIDLGIKPPRHRPACELLDEINMMLVAGALVAKTKVQYVSTLDVIQWLTSL